MYPRVVIAGERSGCGKTTVSLAVMSALSARGLTVQGFKTGPDYIDPSHYEARTGRKGRNIDLWMTEPRDCLELFLKNSSGAHISVIEGVMGLYDGARPDGRASAAHTAKFLRAPVILVLDGMRGPSSAAATALGLKMFDPEVNIAGFILNRAAPADAARAARAVAAATGISYLGFLPPDGDLETPFRHLGLVPANEAPPGGRKLEAERLAASRLDMGLIEKIARSAPAPPPAQSRLFPPSPRPQRARLAVARDKAFSFYYEDTLDLLSLWGCEVAPFSPVSEERLPEGADALYIGGGFPEVYCEELEANSPMREAVRDFCLSGGAVYAECGGMMYLGSSITDLRGRDFEMCGAVGGGFLMRGKLQSIGYREVVASGDAGFFRRGDTERGHEFHYSSAAGDAGGFFNVTNSAGDRSGAGVRLCNTVASYVHLSLVSSGIAARAADRIKPEAGKPEAGKPEANPKRGRAGEFCSARRAALSRRA